jgi:hypothetical protein
MNRALALYDILVTSMAPDKVHGYKGQVVQNAPVEHGHRR